MEKCGRYNTQTPPERAIDVENLLRPLVEVASEVIRDTDAEHGGCIRAAKCVQCTGNRNPSRPSRNQLSRAIRVVRWFA